MPPSMPPAPTVAAKIPEAVLGDVRKDLLDLGLRNPLLNYRLLKARGVEVINERSSDVFRRLVTEGVSFTFLPSDEPSQLPLVSSEDDQVFELALELEEEGDKHHADRYLQTAVEMKALQRRLLATYYTATSSLEEQGVNTLFLALGMVHWREDQNASEFHRAPLLLIPVELVRSTARDEFHLRYTGEEIGPNICFAELLKQQFGLKYPALPDTEDVDVQRYFKAVRKAVASRTGWSVHEDAIVLGFFSFSKFLMFRDLDPTAWPTETSLLEHPLAAALLGSGTLGGDQSPHEANDSLVESASVQVFHVVDADSSQTGALLDALDGRTMVIQGPPGTGKSQTIVNLVAGAVGSGKRVLFVSEKAAALSVVKRRLDAVGLGAACLELHSNKTSKKALIEELKRSRQLELSNAKWSASDLAALEHARRRLNDYCAAVNAPIAKTSETPRRLYGRLLKAQDRLRPVEAPELILPDVAAWDDAEAARHRSLVENLQQRVARCGIPKQHPFWGTGLRIFLPTQHTAVRQALVRASESLVAMVSRSADLAAELGAPRPLTLAEVGTLHASCSRLLEAPSTEGLDLRAPEWRTETQRICDALQAGERYASVHSDWDRRLKPEAWQRTDTAVLRSDLEQFGRHWWRALSRRWRSARSQVADSLYGAVPKSNHELLDVVTAIADCHRYESTLGAASAVMSKLFGNAWQHVQSNWPVLKRQLEWVVSATDDVSRGVLPEWCLDAAPRPKVSDRVKQKNDALARAIKDQRETGRAVAKLLQWDTSGSAPSDGTPIADVQARWEIMASRVADLESLAAFNDAAAECRSSKMRALTEVAESWADACDYLTTLFDKALASKLIEIAFQERPVLAQFDGILHGRIVEQFRDLDRRYIEGTRALVAKRHAAGMPTWNSTAGQIGVLLHEFEKKGRHLPIRKLMEKAGNAIQAIKPVFMMSPLSIANFLSPGALDFDLVVFDEASQVRPADALGAIFRGRQAVVVGDSKQLPPTTFFETMVSAELDGDDGDLPTADIESILGLFCSRGAHQRMLRWHYRSRHESLITVSNHLFYEDRLLIFPSPDQERRELGLIYHRIDNAPYDRSRTRTNPGEAKAVAEAIIRHARQELRKPPERRATLGVAAFSVAQMEAILAQVELLRRENPSCEEFFTGNPYEPFFVKNLETVQGDERDVIFISVGYGRSEEGYIAMNFGPLNRSGGERRLNVLITRARCRCEVFTTLSPDDIDLNRTSATGVCALKEFLTYAATGKLQMSAPSGREPDSPFEEQVLDALTRSGYKVHPQVGCAGFYIDLAIVDPDRPGRYLLGIECDGASYHSASSARDRDRLRQAVLEGLNWRIHRIWSTDWFREPARELQNAIAAIEDAKRSPNRPVSQPVSAANPVSVRPITAGADRKVIAIAPRNAPSPVEQYQLAQLNVRLKTELHLVETGHLSRWLSQVVAVESPVHWLEAARRIATAGGVQRRGSRIQDAFRRACRHGSKSGLFVMKNGFLWKPGQSQSVVRDRSALPIAMKKIEYVAPEEIVASIEQSVRNSYGMAPEEIASATCRLLGFGRVTEEMRTVIEKQRDKLVSCGRLVMKGEVLVCTAPGEPTEQLITT